MDNNISSAIRYVGVDDLDLDLFESQYIVPEGMAYNAYVILDEKTALIDTVDQRKGAEWMANVVAVLDGRTPDYLVVHHVEPDHAGEVVRALQAFPEMQLVASARALSILQQFFPDFDFTARGVAVAEGDTLQLGAHSLKFIAAPMVHWPEVMVSYEASEQVLFSADGFGKFGALVHETDDWACEARRYYFNICGKYGAQVQALLKKAATLPIATIAPTHGPVLRGDLTPYLSLYDTWSSYRPEKEGVFVAYASIHGGTAAAAERLAQILRENGAEEVEVKDLSREDMAEAIESAFELSRMVLCAATYDGSVFPVMYDFLHHLQLKNYQNRRVALLENGSWAPVAARVMRGLLEPMKNIEIVEPVVTIRSRMCPADEAQLQALAAAVLA